MGKKAVRGGWRQWTEAEARGVLSDLDSSGLSAAQFARTKGVSMRRISYWRGRLGPAAATAATPAFVAVKLPKLAPADGDTECRGAAIEIASQGVVLRVREEIDVGRLAEIVGALAARVRGC